MSAYQGRRFERQMTSLPGRCSAQAMFSAPQRTGSKTSWGHCSYGSQCTILQFQYVRRQLTDKPGTSPVTSSTREERPVSSLVMLHRRAHKAAHQ